MNYFERSVCELPGAPEGCLLYTSYVFGAADRRGTPAHLLPADPDRHPPGDAALFDCGAARLRRACAHLQRRNRTRPLGALLAPDRHRRAAARLPALDQESGAAEPAAGPVRRVAGSRALHGACLLYTSSSDQFCFVHWFCPP